MEDRIRFFLAPHNVLNIDDLSGKAPDLKGILADKERRECAASFAGFLPSILLPQSVLQASQFS